MKLPIKKKYFDLIKKGKKDIEFRDAHITFVCETTKRKLTKKVAWVEIIPRRRVLLFFPELKKILTDKKTIVFYLK